MKYNLEMLVDEVACTLVDDAVDFYGTDDIAKLREWATSTGAIEGVIQGFSYSLYDVSDKMVAAVTIEAVRTAVHERLA